MAKRISPEDVREAYERTGWLPVQEEWLSEHDGKQCGCGLSVMVGDTEVIEDLNCGEIEHGMAAVLGLNEGYVAGFVHGFDGGSYGGFSSSDFRTGHEDGRAAWEAVKDLAV